MSEVDPVEVPKGHYGIIKRSLKIFNSDYDFHLSAEQFAKTRIT
jgi:hypothetical protein